MAQLTSLRDYTPSARDHVLRYRRGPYLLVGLILSLLVLAILGVTIRSTLNAPPRPWTGQDAVAAVGISLILLMLIYVIRRCWRRVSLTRHPGAWYLRFGADSVTVNLRNLLDLRTLDPSDQTVIVIPRARIAAVRRTTKEMRGSDDHDVEWVELALDDSDWSDAFAAYSAEFHRIDGRRRDEEDHHIGFYDNGTLRIRIDDGRWPKNLTQKWEALGYRTARHHVLKGPHNMAEAAEQAKRVLP